MKRRKYFKNKDLEYRKIDREIKNACQKAKEDILNEQCKEVEDLEKKHLELMHSKVKQVTNKHRTCSSATCIEAKDDTIIMEKEKILNRWVEYIEELFEDNRKDKIYD